MCLCRYRGSVYETTYRDALKLNKEPHVRLVHVSRRHRRRRHSFLCTLKLRQSCAFEVCALAFHLAVRAALAVRAVLLQLAMRAGVAVRAVLLQLAMRTPLHTHREPLAPSSRKPPALLSRHLEPVPRGVTASASWGRKCPRTLFSFGEKLCTRVGVVRIFAAAAAASKHSVTRTRRLHQRARRSKRHSRRSTASFPVRVPEPCLTAPPAPAPTALSKKG